MRMKKKNYILEMLRVDIFGDIGIVLFVLLFCFSFMKFFEGFMFNNFDWKGVGFYYIFWVLYVCCLFRCLFIF